MANVSGVIQMLRKEHGRLTKELQGINAALAAFATHTEIGQDYQRRHGRGLRLPNALVGRE